MFSLCIYIKAHNIYLGTLSKVCFLTRCLRLFFHTTLRIETEIFPSPSLSIYQKTDILKKNLKENGKSLDFFSSLCPARLFIASRKNNHQGRFVTQENRGRTCLVLGIACSCPVYFIETHFMLASLVSLAQEGHAHMWSEGCLSLQMGKLRRSCY